MTQQYYQANRLSILQKTKDRHERDKQSTNYRMLTNLRKRIGTLRDAVVYHQKKAGHLKEKITLTERRIEKYEIAWGKERSERKRACR